MKARFWLMVVPMWLCLAAGTAAAGGYTVTELGTLPGGGWDSVAYAINEGGQIVGCSEDASGNGHACLWQNGTITDLGILPGSTASVALGINDAGQIVGSSDIAGGQHACLWQNGTVVDLGTLPGYTSSVAYGVNDTRQIVGCSDTGYGMEYHACLWQNGTITDLGTVPWDGMNTGGVAINDAEQIVGASYTEGGYYHACLWQNGTITDLRTLPGDTLSKAWAINDAGEIVGWSEDANGWMHACLWQNGTITDLGVLPGGYGSAAYGINDAGQIVGCSSDASGNWHACLWQDGTITDLGILPGSMWSGALGINDAGQIVGCSYREPWEGHACLWQPGGGPDTELVTSYPTEDEWSSYSPHRGQLHAHFNPDIGFRRPGEPQSATDLLGMYEGRGYDFLAVTEHHQKLESDKDSIFTHAGLTGIVSMKGALEDSHQNDTLIPTGSHILAVGFEQPTDWDAFWSTLGSAPTGDSEGDRLARLANIHDYGGFAFVPHPDSRFYQWPEWMLRDLAGDYEGIELYNPGAEAAGYKARYAEEFARTGDRARARRAGAEAALAEGYAVDTWDGLLSTHDTRLRTTWGTAGDDYHPDFLSRGSFDTTSVVVWTESETPYKAQLNDALRAGRFYATKGGSQAPEILAYWTDPASNSITVLLPRSYRVTFARGRAGRPPIQVDPTNRGDGTYAASYTYNSDDLYVRTEVRDSRGSTSWLQAIWVDEIQTTVGVLPASGAIRAAALSPTLEMEGAALTVSTPQSGLTDVTGTLLNGDDRPPAPPMGYLSRCYGFTPDVALQGTNTLSISYFRDSVRGFPESDLAIYRYSSGASAWYRLDSAVETSGAVTADISQLGIFTVSAEQPTDVGAPTVAITSPSDGGTINAPATITADATDDQGVASVHFYVDGWTLGDDNWGGDGWFAYLDPANYTAGERVLSAAAEDGVGNETTTEITVNIAGLMPDPTITVSGPAEVEVVWGDLQASGSWSGELPMSLAVFTVDDTPLTVIPGVDDSWEVDVPIPVELAGDRTFTATGFDMYGNRGEAAVNVTLRVFPDIPLGFWARDHVYAAARAGIVQGYDDGLYHPEFSVTRDQMAVYIARAIAGGDASVPDPGCSTPVFTDVDCERWARKYIQFCVSQGVVKGYEDGSYHPSEEVNRAQMAVYVARSIASPPGEAGLAGYVPADPRNFPDVPSDFWSYKHVEYCVENGVVQGYDDGYYHPEIIVTRDQMAVYVARAFALPM